MLRNFIATDVAMWIVYYVEGYGVSSAEYRVHLLSV